MFISHVWHTKYGNGTAVKLSRNRAVIDFENYGRKTFELNLWGTALFTSSDDAEHLKDPKTPPSLVIALKNKYKKISQYGNVIDQNELIINQERIDKQLLFSGLCERQTRNIMILLIRKVICKDHKLLQIIGVDIFTGSTVNIVDDEGCEYGCHSYDEKFQHISPNCVLQADFEIFKSEKYLNSLKMKGDFIFLGVSNPLLLEEKYEVCCPEKSFLCSIDDLPLFCWMHPSTRSLFVVKAEKVKLRKIGGTYRIRLNGTTIAIKDPSFDYRTSDITFTGFILLQCQTNHDGNSRCTALRMIASGICQDVSPKPRSYFERYQGYDDDYNRESYEEEIYEELEQEYEGLLFEFNSDVIEGCSEYADCVDEMEGY